MEDIDEGISGLEILLLSMAAFGPLAFGCVEPWSEALLEIGFFSLAALCAWRRPAPPRSTVYSSLLPATLALILLGAVQWARPAAVDAPPGLGPFTVSAHDTGRALVRLCAYAALMWSAPRVLRTPASLRRCAWTIFSVGVAVAVVGIAQILHDPRLIYGFRHVTEYRYFEAFGPYYNRDHAASLMGMAALVGIGLFVSRFSGSAARRAFGDPADFAAAQGVLLLAILIVVIGIIESGSRAGYGALVAAFLGGVLLPTAPTQARSPARAGKARLLRLGAAGTAAAGLAVFFVFQTKFAARVKHVAQPEVAGTVSARIYMYRVGAEMFSDAPIFGWGLGSFARVFSRYEGPEVLPNQRVEHVHSEWLELALETGIVGAAVLAAGLLALAAGSRRSWRSCESPGLRSLAAWMACAAGYFALHATVDFSFQIPANAAIFILILCCIGSPMERLEASTASARGRALGPAAAAALAAGCGAMSVAAVLPAAAWWETLLAERAPLADRPALLERAAALDPSPEAMYRAAAAYLSAAEAAPGDASRSGGPLAKALAWSTAAFRAEPSNAQFRYLQGAVLWRFGRRDDASPFLDDGQRG